MSMVARAPALLALLLLAACQQAVRPNIEAPPAPGTTVAPTAIPSPEVPPPEASPPPPAPEPVVPANPEPTPDPVFGMGGEVFERLRSGLGPGACDAGGTIARRWRQRFTADQQGFSRQLESALPLLDYVSREVAQKQLPAEFALIPLVESGYHPGAVGVGKPLGLWQMIGSTARNHGIVIRPGYDGRLSPVESTHAALSYLDSLSAMMGSWHATVMAYNAGENRVRSALARSPAGDPAAGNRHPHGLDNVTYDYVGKLQALSCLIADPDREGIQLPMQARFERLREMTLDPDMTSIDQLAGQLGISGKSLRELNPAYRGGHVAKGVPREVLVPASAGIGASLPRTTAP
jgi:membrane-bound lytic murein transglycosylase D